MAVRKGDLLQGTLDLLVLKVLGAGPLIRMIAVPRQLSAQPRCGCRIRGRWHHLRTVQSCGQ
jgi:hypothetical protein